MFRRRKKEGDREGSSKKKKVVRQIWVATGFEIEERRVGVGVVGGGWF